MVRQLRGLIDVEQKVSHLEKNPPHIHRRKPAEAVLAR